MKAPTALIALSYFAHLGLCFPGTATRYRPPYTPNKCYHDKLAEIPGDGLFGAVGPHLWNKGAACGRKFKITCYKPVANGQGLCTGTTITIKIIEGRLGNRSPDFSLSTTAADLLYTGEGTFRAQFVEV
uniref:Plant natriuretic peptide-like 10 n=1 Tax=Venturia pyrina TaxID=415593 RepID=A0A513ZSA0_9PEZI|nr:plant natriuretic peptide-like 10 [Venturia pyrina]